MGNSHLVRYSGSSVQPSARWRDTHECQLHLDPLDEPGPLSVVWRYYMRTYPVKGLIRTAYWPGFGAGRSGPGAAQLPLQPLRGQLADDALWSHWKPVVIDSENSDTH
jgi:hypothetical protein